MVWFVLAGMAACAVLAALWPLLRPSSGAKADPAANEAAFYKAQLEEIRRDVERGLLPQGEAESARAEAARRLIAAASGPSEAPLPARRTRLAAAVLIAVGLPAVAFLLYGRLGQPMLPDEPLASRKVTPQTDGGIEAAVAAVEARLTAKPDDGKGWAVIAPVYMRLERYADAAHAFAEALRILGEDPLRRAAYGEALVAAAGGVITDEARQAFDRALAEQPGQPQARYYVALAAEQDGKKADAIRDYQALLTDFSPGCALAEHGERTFGCAEGRPSASRGRRRHSRSATADDRGHGVETRHATRQQRRQHRRMVAPYSRLYSAA